MAVAGVIATTLLIGVISITYALRLKRLTQRSLTWLLISGALAVGIVWHVVHVVSCVQGVATPTPDLLPELAALILFVLALSSLVLVTPLFESAAQTREALFETEQRYKNLFENAHVGIYRTTPDGRILIANPALMRMVGCRTFEELARRNLEREGFGPGYSRERFKELVARPGGVRGLEAEWTREDGTRLIVRENAIAVRDSEGRILYYEGTVEDITERVQAERRLAESEARYRMLVELAPIGIAVHREGKGLFVNPAAARILGVQDPNTFIGHSIFDYVHPDDHQAARERIQRVAQQREVVQTFPVRYIHSDGHTIHVEATNAPIEFEGQPAVMTVFQDIGERRRTEELERQLAKARKMEALGRLAGGVAHDFNNLLTAIIGFASLLKEVTPEDDPTRASVEEILKAGNRAAALTGQLLSFSRRQVIEPRILDPNQVIRDMETLLRRLTGEDVTLSMSLAADVRPILIDQSQFEQVIVNLAINARDAMPAGGELTLSTDNVEVSWPEPLDADEALAAGSYVRLSVSDTGVGMEPEVLSHIFEPFFTTKGLGSGTGLGLSTVYGIVRQAGGHVRVQSAVGKGTRFDLFFPAASGTPSVDMCCAPSLQTFRGTESILLVEDDAAVRDLSEQVLRKLGYRVTAAENGRQALELVRQGSQRVDLVVTDVVMPGLSGVELAQRMREVHPRLRVLFVSGYSNVHGVENGIAQPRTTYLRKPFTPDQLASQVRRLLDAVEPETTA